MSITPQSEPNRGFRLSPEVWAIAAATLLVLAIVVGVLPGGSW